MRVADLLPLVLSPMAMGLVVPKDITPEQLNELVARDVDFPENPRLNVGSENCFEIENIPEGEVRTTSLTCLKRQPLPRALGITRNIKEVLTTYYRSPPLVSQRRPSRTGNARSAPPRTR
jgi:hypothetical protein